MQTTLLFVSLTTWKGSDALSVGWNMSEPRSAYTVRLRIIYNGHNARLMHDPVCHCNCM